MRNSLIDEKGSYKSMSWKSNNKDKKKVIWSLVGSESNGMVMDTLDTFSNGKGDYKTFTRRQIDEQIELGNITAV